MNGSRVRTTTLASDSLRLGAFVALALGGARAPAQQAAVAIDLPLQEAKQETPATPPPEPPPSGFIELLCGDRLSGKLDIDAETREFKWKSEAFDTSLVYPVTALRRVVFPPLKGTEEPGGALRVLLANGDVVFGDLKALDAKVVSIATTGQGTLDIPRENVVSLMSLKNGPIAYEGPNGIPQWTARATSGALTAVWQQGIDGLESAGPGAALVRTGLLERYSRLHLNIAWGRSPTFRIRLGATNDAARDASCVTIETWGNDLVAYREKESDVEIVELVPKVEDDEHCEISIGVDAGTFVFFGSGDTEIGKISRASDDGNGLAIENLAGSKLRIADVSVARKPVEGWVRGKALLGEDIASLDASGALVLKDGTVVPVAELAEVTFKTTVRPDAATAVVFRLQDGARASGEFVGLEPGLVRVRVPWIEKPLALSFESGNTLAFNEKGRAPPPDAQKLTCEKSEVRGQLAGFVPEEKALLWQPVLAEGKARLTTNRPYHISLRETGAFAYSRSTYPHRILFANTDSVPCRIEAISPTEVLFESAIGGQKRAVSTEDVKALEFDAQRVRLEVDDYRIAPKVEADQAWWIPWTNKKSKGDDRGRVDRQRRDVILAQPRKYKSNPPNHLFLGRNGDILRGDLGKCHEDEIQISHGLSEPTKISRESLMAIIFLHPQPAGPEPQPPPAPNGTFELKIDKETRISGVIIGADDTTLTLQTRLIGEVKVPIEDIVEMMSGELCGKSPGFFTGWVLKPMIEPPD